MFKTTLILFFILLNIYGTSQEKPVKEAREVPEPRSIELAIDKLVADPSLANASISFYVYDASNKLMIEEYNGATSLVTASTMKVITTATALQYLGSYHKFNTELSYNGYIDTNCTLQGNIYIEGGGDPTLGSKYFKKENEDFMNE